MIGEHTDYNGGHVFPCALTIGTYAAVKKRTDRKLRFYSMNFESLGIVESSLDDLTPSDKAGWTNYPKGVMWAFAGRGMKMDCGLDIVLKWKHSQWIGVIFFCIFRGADGLLSERSVWV